MLIVKTLSTQHVAGRYKRLCRSSTSRGTVYALQAVATYTLQQLDQMHAINNARSGSVRTHTYVISSSSQTTWLSATRRRTINKRRAVSSVQWRGIYRTGHTVYCCLCWATVFQYLMNCVDHWSLCSHVFLIIWILCVLLHSFASQRVETAHRVVEMHFFLYASVSVHLEWYNFKYFCWWDCT